MGCRVLWINLSRDVTEALGRNNSVDIRGTSFVRILYVQNNSQRGPTSPNRDCGLSGAVRATSDLAFSHSAAHCSFNSQLWPHLVCFNSLSSLWPQVVESEKEVQVAGKSGTFFAVLHMYVPIMSSPLPFGEVIKVFTWNKSDKPLRAASLLYTLSFNQKQQGRDPPIPWE